MLSWSRIFRNRAALATTVLLAVSATTAPGQGIPPIPPGQQVPPTTIPGTIPVTDRGTDPWSTLGDAQSAPHLDRLISRTEYRLSAGDVLTLSVLGYSDRIFRITVTPEGTVVIPTVGVSPVAGMTIEEAEQRIARDVRRFYSDADVALSLTGIRSFKVFVVGAVEDPGVRLANSVTRVSELVPPEVDGPLRRTVLLRRRTGDTVRVDLLRFERTGDLTYNPTLTEGDAVQVGAIDETVAASGELPFPGSYEFRPGESLAEFLHVANGYGGFSPRAADTLWLRRFDGTTEGEIVRIAREDAVGPVGLGIRLQPFDAVYVPRLAHFREQNTVRVGGEVWRPGTYPIRPNVTTVRQVIEMAGGFTPGASLIDAVLRRAPTEHPRDSLRLLDNVPPELLSEEDRRILEVNRRADDRNVVLDFPLLFAEGGGAYDVPLRNGDQLFIPERRDEVAVLGAVVQPGLVSFAPGQPVAHFVAKAGGYSRRADKNDVVVMKARLGTRTYLDDRTPIEPGDRIIVPFREPRTFFGYIASAQGVVSTISGIILTVVGVERLWDRISQ